MAAPAWLPAWLAARVHGRPLVASMLANIAWLMLDKVLKLVVGLGITVWLARHLGPQAFGQYSYVLAFVAMFSGLATLGLPTIAVRELVRARQAEPPAQGAAEARAQRAAEAEILGTTLALLLAGATLAVALILAVALWVRPEAPALRLGIALVAGTLLFQTSALVRWWFESRVAARAAVLAETLALLAGAALKAALILADAPLWTFFAAVLTEAALLAVLLALAWRSMRAGVGRWRPRLARAASLMRGAWPLALSGAVLMVQARVDQFMLAELADDRELGYYGVALRVAEGLVFIALALQSTMFPALVQARQAADGSFRRKLMSYYRASFVAALVVCVPLALLGQPLVLLLFGPAYAPAGWLLVLMAARVFLAFVGIARSAFLVVDNLQHYATFTVIVGTLLNVLLNLWWIPTHRAEGAVWASLVSFAVTIFVLDLAHPRARANVLDLVRAAASLHRLRSA